jgi:hypothetical protein
MNCSGTASATYAAGDGTATLSFNYTVKAGDNAIKLDYANTAAIDLNGSGIEDALGNTAVLTLPTPGAVNSLSANNNIKIYTGP